MKRKQELTSCAHPQFNDMHTIRSISHNSVRKEYKPVYIFIDCSVTMKHFDNFCFSIDPRSTFICRHYSDEARNTKRNTAYQCHYCDCFSRYWKKVSKHIKHCPGFAYTFQDENLEYYENCIKHKKDFPFTVLGDLETTTGYISEIVEGSVFITSYCQMFNFHPNLKMTPITCLRSFGQNEEELENITIPGKFWPYVNKGDLKCFMDACETVLEKKQEHAISTLCKVEMWMVYRCFRHYFDTVVKINNYQLT